MNPKCKTCVSYKQDKPSKKNHIMGSDSITDTDDNGSKADDFAGKDYNFDVQGGKSFSKFQMKNTIQPVKEEENADQNEPSILALNHLLQLKSKLNLHGSVSWKAYVFPTISKNDSVKINPVVYFGLDLVEDETERTIWSHKASSWKDVIEAIFELAEDNVSAQSINQIFKGILACPVRAVPNDPNEPETFTTGKGQNIQHWIMLIPMPADVFTSDYIKCFISEFGALIKRDLSDVLIIIKSPSFSNILDF